MIDALPYPDDFLLAQKCLEGDPLSIGRLQEICEKYVVDYLVHAGATPEQARELASELRADCLAERTENKPRLATYGGNSPLRTWLKAVALNKLVQLKRREKRVRQADLDDQTLDDVVAAESARTSSLATRYPTEAPLLEIMRGAVEAAFHECDAEDFVLVQFAHANGLLGRELAQMFSCSEAKISRDLERARRNIADATLNYVREQDPWLELQWEDFLDLCRVASPACFGVE
ncbi:MAG: ECF-type sigma factor [Chthoniobacter sp.]|nr:ECF-type sigma factor [Chthoniobacter sp.]